MKCSLQREWSGRSVLTNGKCPYTGHPWEWPGLRSRGVGAGVGDDRDMYLGSPAQRSNPFMYHFWWNISFDIDKHQNENDPAIGASFKILYIVFFKMADFPTTSTCKFLPFYVPETCTCLFSQIWGINGTQLNRVNFGESLQALLSFLKQRTPKTKRENSWHLTF